MPRPLLLCRSRRVDGAMSRIPLICPRCGETQRVVPGGPEKAVKVVHAATGREACAPADAPEPTGARPSKKT